MLDMTIRSADVRLALAAYRRARGRSVRFYAAEHVAYCLYQVGCMAGEW